MTEQVPIKLLLSDPIYKAWTKKPPQKRAVIARNPWRVYALFEGHAWAKRDFPTYAKAYNFFRLCIREPSLVDGAIHSSVTWFKPPVVKMKGGKRTYWPMPTGHRWCGYCRRPVVYKYFSRHHMWASWMQGGEIPWRCCSICGGKEDLRKEYPSKLRSRL